MKNNDLKSEASQLSHAEAINLIHQLEVHQIELEVSNDELIQAKEQIEFAARKYAGLYNFAPTGYITLSSDGTILEANISGAKMLAKERVYLINSRFDFFVSNDTKKVFNLFLEKAFRSNTRESCEITLASSENQPVFVHLTGIFTEKGDQCLVNMFDITTSKQVALLKEIHHEVLEILNEPETLRDTLPRLINIIKIKCGFDAVGIRLEDGDDFPYFAQNGFSTDFLCTENSLVSRTKDGELFYDKNGDVSLECFCGLVIAGKADPANPLMNERGSIWTNDSFPFLSIPSDEDPRMNPRNLCIHHGYASMALIPIKNTSRNIGLIQFNSRSKDFFTPDLIENLEGIARHIGEVLIRKKAEEELQKLEAKHSSMISNISEVIGIIGADGFMKYKSPNIEKWFGWQPQDLIGTDGFLTVHPDDLQRIQKEFFALLEDPSLIKKVIYRYKCKDGSYKPIELTATNQLKDPAISGILLNYRDITERQEAELEIKLMNTELLKLNVEKDKFFSIVSHDLRSPFQTLLGYFPLTMEEIKTYPLEKVQLLLMNMRTSSEKLYVMVENLLEWSKMQQGLIGFSPSSIRLKEAISSLLVIIRKSSDKKMIKISCDIPEHLVVTADKRMLESILNNLIFNAVKFTHKSGKITISAMTIPGNYVGISIKDTGIGMNKDMIDRLFHLDADISTKGTEGEYSTGLGLFICKDFVDKHGGRIWVESEEGKGSTFQFALPGKANDLSVFSFSPGMKKGN